MKYKKDKMVEKYISENGMWMIELDNGRYNIMVQTCTGAWKKIGEYSTVKYGHKQALELCKKYIDKFKALELCKKYIDKFKEPQK